MARSMAADALTRGGWASGSAKRWHTCHRNGSAEGQPRARVLSRRGAAVEGRRPGTRGSRQCSDRGGGSAHVGKRAEWPAGSGQRRGKGSGHTCGHYSTQDGCRPTVNWRLRASAVGIASPIAFGEGCSQKPAKYPAGSSHATNRPKIHRPCVSDLPTPIYPRTHLSIDH